MLRFVHRGIGELLTTLEPPRRARGLILSSARLGPVGPLVTERIVAGAALHALATLVKDRRFYPRNGGDLFVGLDWAPGRHNGHFMVWAYGVGGRPGTFYLHMERHLHWHKGFSLSVTHPKRLHLKRLVNPVLYVDVTGRVFLNAAGALGGSSMVLNELGVHAIECTPYAFSKVLRQLGTDYLPVFHKGGSARPTRTRVGRVPKRRAPSPDLVVTRAD